MRTFVIGVIVGAAAVAFGPAFAANVGPLVAAQVGAAAPSGPPLAIPVAPSAAASGVATQIGTVDLALAQAAKTGKAVPVTLTFNERDLTTAAAAYFPQSVSGATLTDPVVHLRPGVIVLDMNATLVVVHATAEAIATVTVRSGRPATTVTTATIAGATVPQSTGDQVATQLNDALGAGLPPKFIVSSITITTGVMTVVGVANP